ncbi:MAG: hypothetical protein WB239_12210 [Acidimicrobiia bacterium]
MPGRHRLGWTLFLASAGLFLVTGIRDGDLVLVIASIVFGVGCVLFLIRGGE